MLTSESYFESKKSEYYTHTHIYIHVQLSNQKLKLFIEDNNILLKFRTINTEESSITKKKKNKKQITAFSP